MVTFNNLCATCTQPCKQAAEVKVVACVNYEKQKPSEDKVKREA